MKSDKQDLSSLGSGRKLCALDYGQTDNITNGNIYWLQDTKNSDLTSLACASGSALFCYQFSNSGHCHRNFGI